jgi:hypothetical protein
MDIGRAMPVNRTTNPPEVHAFYVDFFGLRVGMDQDGMLMLASPT